MSDKSPPTKKAIIEPIPPIILIIPFASLRSGAGVTSGISEITGLRHKAIIRLNPTIVAMNVKSVC